MIFHVRASRSKTHLDLDLGIVEARSQRAAEKKLGLFRVNRDQQWPSFPGDDTIHIELYEKKELKSPSDLKRRLARCFKGC